MSMSLPAAIDRSAAPAAVRVAVERLTDVDRRLAKRLEDDACLQAAFCRRHSSRASLCRLLSAALQATRSAWVGSRSHRRRLAS